MRSHHAIPIILLAGAVALAFHALEPGAAAAEKAAPTVLRVGIINTMFRDNPEKQLQSMSGPFKSLMEEQAGIPGEVVSGGDAEKLSAQLKEGKLQLGAFNGFEFGWARVKNPDLKPLMIAVDRQSFARAVLVVRDDNKAADAAALKGQTMALSRLAREHCRLFLERRCVPQGMTTDKFFAKLTTPGTAQDALDDVAENFAQATVVDDVDLASFRKSFPKTGAKLRVLAESEKFPCVVIAYQAGGVDADTLKGLRTGMIDAKSTERGRKLLDLCRTTGFEAVPDDYEKTVADIIKAYPPPMK